MSHLDTALLAARVGLSTVPPKEDGSKAPLGSWKKYQTTRAGESQIRGWYQNGRQGVGLVCGEVSGGLEMLEFEGRAVRDGIQKRFKELAEAAGLVEVLERLRNGYVEQTPTEGIHLLWRCIEIDGNLQLARRITDDGEIQVLIETRGEGGYTIIAPSSGPVHETGKPYVLVRGGLDSIPTITPDERRHLLNIARSLDEMPEEPKESYDWTQATGDRPGDIYNDRSTGADVVALLERHGWERVYQFADRVQMRRPGKSIGVSATVFDSGVFVCFTTSTRFDGYDQGTKRGVYSPFGVYTILEHGGDHSAAARSLAPEYKVKVGPGPISDEGAHLPESFWSSRPELDHIRRAAHSRGRSADAVLVACLARLAADTPHTVRLPAIVGSSCNLALIGGIGGPPGTGKSSSVSVARELLPATILKTETDGVPAGSGEGLIELLFDWVLEDDPESGKKKKVHRQVHHNAYMYIDEGEILTKLARQSTNTLLPNLRAAFTSETLGQANASQERKRIIPAGQAVYGVVVGIQPDLAVPLFSEAGAGTPQRFLWASSTSPTPAPGDRPEWPGPLARPTPSAADWRSHQKLGAYTYHELGVAQSIQTEIAVSDHHRQQHGADALDEHHDLIRLKVAGVLAIMQGRLDVDEADWQLAAEITDMSRQVRHGIQAHINEVAARTEAETSARLARRQVDAARHSAEWWTVETARRLAGVVAKSPGELSRGKLRVRLTVNHRDYFEDGLDHAMTVGWITEHTEEGQGTSKTRYYPGDTKP